MSKGKGDELWPEVLASIPPEAAGHTQAEKQGRQVGLEAGRKLGGVGDMRLSVHTGHSKHTLLDFSHLPPGK